ncbi:MAG: hypothetical protein IPM82_23905 [Saprospiraceae bacterium]|nr:hypothetical protein [Saprospiraceae bacterium]
MWASTENLDTVSRDALQTNLLGDWMNIGQNKLENGFASLNLLAMASSRVPPRRVSGFVDFGSCLPMAYRLRSTKFANKQGR